jgi:hypothetical protein
MGSKAVRDRKNRKDTSGSHQAYLLGAMVSIRTYNGETRMVEVSSAIPSSAEFAGRMADGLLPKEN